jgi:hypothetical protein
MVCEAYARGVLVTALTLGGPAALAAVEAQPTSPPCDGSYLETARKTFKALFDRGRFKEAVAGLSEANTRCAEYLRSSDEDVTEQRLWIVSDMALALYKSGDKSGCERLIAKVRDEFPESSQSARLKPVWKALAFNYSRCDCYLTHPLCRETTWLKTGYAEVKDRVNPKFPVFTIRAMFDVVDQKQTRADGSAYLDTTVTFTSVRVFDEGGTKLLQELPVEDGRVDIGDRQAGPLWLHDMNFDGCLDIEAGRTCGTGGCIARRWLCEPGTARFVFHPDLSGVLDADFDAEKKEIRSSFRASLCEGGEEVLKWEGAELVVVERTTSTCEGEEVRERRVDGALKVIPSRKTRTRPKGRS